jgi:hypothetical protein
LLKTSANRVQANKLWVGVLGVAIVAIASFIFLPASHRSPSGLAKSAAVSPLSAAQSRIRANYAALPLAFEQNKGQTDAQVKYMARGDGYTLFLTANDAVFSLRSRTAAPQSSAKSSRGADNFLRPGVELHTSSAAPSASPAAGNDLTAVVHMQLTGANSSTKISASDRMPGVSNYFVGSDRSKWQTGVVHFARVSYKDVYPGINLAFHGAQRQTEFDFIVAPEANPAPIAFHFSGAQDIKTDDAGNLVIASRAGNILLHKPVAYQEQNGTHQLVEARFSLKANNQVAFALGNYDRSRELVIDPSVSYLYSTYLGGTGDDEGQGIAVDGNGNAYVTGQTASTNFPTTSGAYQTSQHGTSNVFVSKIKSDGSTLMYSTYVGGSGNPGDAGNAIAVDGSGNAYVTGGTNSTDFPHSNGAFQTALNGTSNAFLFKLTSSGSFSYGTYLGGNQIDSGLGIALATDGSGDAFIVGRTNSHDFPTQNPVQTGGYPSGSASAAFVTKFNSSGTALAYSSFLGGSSDGDTASGIAIDSSNNAYITGQTFSTSFPTTTGAYQTACNSCSNGNSNAFVTVLNPAGSDYVYSTFLGGTALDAGDGITVDSTGAAYVVGVTTSSTFPTTAGAYQTTYGGSTDAFITKLSSTGAALLYSTFLGGSGFDTGAGIALDASGNAYVTGQTSSSFPVSNPTQASPGGGNDAFVAELNPAAGTSQQLIFATYLGGSGDEDDGGNYGGIAVSSTGANIYVTGNTASTNFPTQTPFPYNGGGANSGGNDAFVTAYTQTVSSTYSLSGTALSPSSISPGGSATSTITASSTTGFTGSVTLSCTVSPAVTLGPTCATASATPGTPATLTVNTTAATSMLQPPLNRHSSGMLYAMLLPLTGMALMGMTLNTTRSRRKKLFGLLLIGMVMATLLLMPACGGSSSSGGGGGGGGTPGTPANTYTIVVNGSATGANQTGVPPSLTLTVN